MSGQALQLSAEPLGRGFVERTREGGVEWGTPSQAKATCKDQTQITIWKERRDRKMGGSLQTTSSGGGGRAGLHKLKDPGSSSKGAG